MALALVFVALLALLSVNVAFAYDGTGQRPGITDQAHKMHDLYLLVLAIGSIVFVAVEGALIFILIRFRRRDDTLPAQTHGNNLLEVVWTSIPVIIVVILFVFSFITLVDVEDEGHEQDLTVDVTGFQWQWKFDLNSNDLGPNSDKSGENKTITILGTSSAEPTIVIPVNENVQFRLHASDVIHSFYVQDFLYKLDVIPGRENKFTVRATETGTFPGQCAEFCGDDHALMRFHLKVVTRAEFDAWAAEQLAGSQTAAKQP
ncbi:hypothetical protein AYO38_10400 [bacterium SCGC AG-212-C10]|nr:hypothetical protein AYO38_10400 [bacterium SCGC AG-212-C10]